MTTPAASQDPGTATQDESGEEAPDPTVAALERKKKIAELKKAIAEAEKLELAAKLPTTETKGSDGGVTLKEGAGYFAELLAYHALDDAAGEVAKTLGTPAPGARTLLISADLELAKQAQLWEILNSKLGDFKKRFSKLLEAYPETYDFAAQESVAGGLTAATAILGAAADIAAFFRSSTEISSRAVSLSERALEALVARPLIAAGWQVVDPSFTLAKTTLATELDEAMAKRSEVADRRRTLEGRVQPTLTKLAEKRLELQGAQARLTQLEAAKPPDTQAIQKAREELNSVKQEILIFGTREGRWNRAATEIDGLLTAFDALVKAITEGAEGKASPLEAVALIDVLKGNPAAKILLLDIASQGGEIHVSKSVWRTRLTYIGGTVVTFFLTDHKGEIHQAGTVSRQAAKSTSAKDAPSELQLPK